MWILPTNHPLSSAFAQGYVDSKEELRQHWDHNSESQLLWKSKHLSLKTFWRLWSTVWWFPHLYGRILKRSHLQPFTERYTASLAVIPVNRSPWPENGRGVLIQDTFGRLYEKELNQLNLFGSSLKTSMIISLWDLTKFTKTYESWVILSRSEYTQRKRLAQHMNGRGFIYSASDKRWPTPTAMIQDESLITFFARKEKALAKKINGNGIGMNLPHAVKMWPTPVASEYSKAVASNNQNSLSRMVYRGEMNWKTPVASEGSGGVKEIQEGVHARVMLRDQVAHWQTPKASDSKDTKMSDEAVLKRMQRKGGGVSGILEQIQRLEVGQPDRDLINTTGKNRELLNPAWSIQLMGTTLSVIFTVPLAMEWWNRQPKKP